VRHLFGVDVLRPDPAGTIQSLSSLGYTPEAAVADLVDNSVAAGAGTVHIDTVWRGGGAAWVTLRDDGGGMDLPTLLRGLTVGGRGHDQRAATDLGRFGMGLKTASFSQARQLVVASRPDRGAWNVRTWDIDHVLEVGDWELLHGCPPDARDILASSTAAVQGAGTVVLWRRLTRLAAAEAQARDEWAMQEFYRNVNQIERHLGMVFHRYLGGRKPKLRIVLNGQPVPGWDPFLTGHRFVEPLAAETPLPGVQVQGFVLPHRSRLTEQEYLAGAGPRGWIEQQGFYVYRRDRLIVAGDWLHSGDFRKDERHTLARVAVELPPDQDLVWSLDVKKSTAMPPAALAKHLRRVAKATRDRAAAVTNHRGKILRDRRTDSIDFTWQAVTRFGRRRFVVNREHALIRDLVERAPEHRRDILDVLTMVENALPLGAIQATSDVADLAKADIDGDVPDEMLDLARHMLEVLLNRGERADAAFTRVVRMPPFSDYGGLADRLSGDHPGEISE
jgi:hypothetical protein